MYTEQSLRVFFRNKRMKKNKQLKDFQITSFIEGEDDDGHYKLEGDLEIAGIM